MPTMENHRLLYARDWDELERVFNLRPRQSQCYKCDDTAPLKCPDVCPEGQSCQLQIPVGSCTTECAQSVCLPTEAADPTQPDNETDEGGPNVGAIAGGVIGGVIFIAVLTYLAWRFLIKPKRAQEAQSQYDVGMDQSYGSEKDNATGLTRRSSTHTVHSIASTVLTRASNIIQIAYIPGVTNRANPNSGLHVPPVPPIPSELSANGREDMQDDQHFFMPGDLRDSTYSGLSGYSDRTSFARTSYAPRSSVASTIYGKQAQIAAPAQSGMRLKPTMVSVKTVGSNSSGDSTPPVPTINLERFGDNRRDSEASNFSVGSTFLNTATQARAHIVKVGSGLKKVEIGSKSDASSSKSTISNPHAVEKDTDEPSAGSALAHNRAAASPASTTTPTDPSPFSDPPETATPLTLRSTNSPMLGPVIEAEPEEEQRAANATPQRSFQRATSPFSDEHATK